MSALLLFFLSLVPPYLSLVCAHHGLVYENPKAFSPAAYDFFHPNSQQPSKNTHSPSPLSTFSSASSAVAQSTEAHESNFPDPKTTAAAAGSRVGAGGIAGIVFGFALVVLLAMGVYYVVITRRSNITRANSVRPDA
ncbi:uncharacterized protein LOC122094737 [Macadamia integrifolia]|uniref:uncharacterized protein LOC122094737 n=1 Tax=Macadamia integrifolia TaxID=60698 RepID=UPI001C52F2B2|nr:uncharacterized protein LOC122094737 [Macadamia integrifolia]